VLVFTEAGWEIEKETFANELLLEFDELIIKNPSSYDMSYLKDRNRSLIWHLLDKVETSKDPKYLPLLEAWAQIDYKKVKQRIEQVMYRMREAGKHTRR
jgi:hypothetical protein